MVLLVEMSHIIEVKGLIRMYGDLLAVDHVSFSVKKGEVFAFLGPNGAGKTTIIKMLTTLLRPHGGYVRLNGFDPAKEPHRVRRSIGVVFQDPSLDEELTAYENMEFHGILYKVPKKLRRQRIEELLTMVGLWDRRRDLVKKFSGGMKRRLEIARGLLHHPEILFLDEPTIGLDPQTRVHIWYYVERLNREEGITIFFTTHYLHEAERVADRIAIIDNGRIVAQGSLEDLRERTGKTSLEEIFIALTGRTIRDEEARHLEGIRLRKRMFR